MEPNKIYERYHKYAKRGVLKEVKEKSSRLKEKFSIIEESVIPKIKKGSILDLGCGLGYTVNLISSHGYKVEGSDISKTAISQAKKSYSNYRFFVLDITKNSTKKKFDNILLLGVMEHLFDYKKALYNLNKSIGVQGMLILQLPCVSWFKHRLKFLFGNADFLFQDDWHIRHFYPAYLKKLLEFYGFGNIHFKGYGRFRKASLCGTMIVSAEKLQEKEKFERFSFN